MPGGILFKDFYSLGWKRQVGKEHETRRGNLWISNLGHISSLPFLTVHSTSSGWVPWRTEITQSGPSEGKPRLLRECSCCRSFRGAPTTDALCWRLGPHCSLCEGNLLSRKVAQRPCYHMMRAGPKAPQIIKTWLFLFQRGAGSPGSSLGRDDWMESFPEHGFPRAELCKWV